jgi:hypothetical protein
MAGACVGFDVETPEPNLAAGMQWLQNAYTRRYNIRHGLWGRLFGDRYKAILNEGDSPYYYCSLMDYVHLNPVRAGLVKFEKGESVRDYPWSSVSQGYAVGPNKRAEWLAVEEGLAMTQCPDTAVGRRRFVEHLDDRALEEGARKAGVIAPEGDRRRSHLRHGWYWGSQAFAEKALHRVGKRAGSYRNRTYRSGGISKAHDEKMAERIVEEGLAAAGLEKKEMGLLPGSDPRKVALATLLIDRTIVRQEWIADRLKMSSAANVSQQVRRNRTRRLKLSSQLKAYLQSVKIC